MNRAYLVDWAKTENPALIPTLEGMARLLAWMSLLAGVLMMVGVAMVAFAGPSAFPLVMAIGGLNRPGIPGDSIPWKRGWSHGREAPQNKEVPA